MSYNWSQMYQEQKHQKPNFSTALGLLTHLNAEELRAYLNDEEKFESIVKDVKELKDIETEKEIVIASNRSLAEFNLAKEPFYTERKREVQQLTEDGEKLFNSIEAKSEELAQREPKQNLETTLALLQTAAAEMEEETEELATKFLDGSMDVEGFLEQFSSHRKIMHLRRVKADKMTDMVRKRMWAATAAPRNSSIPTTNSFYSPPPPPGLASYPVASVPSMPMPSLYTTPNNFG